MQEYHRNFKDCTKKGYSIKKANLQLVKISEASQSATADICITVLETIIALWKGNKLEKPQIQIKDKNLQEIGIIISNTINSKSPIYK